MFSRGLVRSVTFAAATPRIGCSTLVGNVAVALARAGQNVCVLDQAAGSTGVAGALGVECSHDLVQVIRRDRALDDVVEHGPEGVRFVAAGQGSRLLGALPKTEERRLVEAFDGLSPAVDMLLVDAPSAGSDALSSWTLASTEVVIVMSPGADSITSAYGLMKRLSRDAARRRFHVVVNRARTASEARAIFDNLEATARRFLSASVAWLGWVPDDADLQRATRLRQAVVGAYPQASSAAAIRAIADTAMHWPHAGEDRLDGFVHRLVQASRLSLSVNV
jgi:flagellar biosynthesis protein FlhG